MTADEPSGYIREAVTIALDEHDVLTWLAQWQAAPGPLRERMETQISLAAVVRNHNDPERRQELLQFHAIVDEPNHDGQTSERP